LRNIILSLLVFISSHSFAGLSDISAVMLPGTVQEHYGDPHNEGALSTIEAINSLEAFSIGMGSEKQGANMVLIAESTSKYTDFGGYQSYAFAVMFDSTMPQKKMRLNGYMVKPKKGKKYIVYPLATAFGENKELLGPLIPSNESDIKGNTISNIVTIPEGTKYLLLHTNSAYVTFDLSTGKKISTDRIAEGLASLGGAVGGLFNGVLFNSQVKRGKVGIAPVGIVEVMQYKP
jgi:hypothetical protein